MAVKELLTIKEFADLAGKSPQAIYKQLNSRLKPFVQSVDNKKMLKSKALWEVFSIDPENPPEVDQLDMSIESGLEKTLFEILRKELETQSKRIEFLEAELSEERKHAREQADKIAVFADQAQKLQLAQMNQRMMEEDEELEEPEIMPEKEGILKKLDNGCWKIEGLSPSELCNRIIILSISRIQLLLSKIINKIQLV